MSWQEYAACAQMDVMRFFEHYEMNAQSAMVTDEICLSCPVIEQCREAGISGSEWGVWGGVYLQAGSIDKQRNNHKTKEVWKRLAIRLETTK